MYVADFAEEEHVATLRDQKDGQSNSFYQEAKTDKCIYHCWILGESTTETADEANRYTEASNKKLFLQFDGQVGDKKSGYRTTEISGQERGWSHLGHISLLEDVVDDVDLGRFSSEEEEEGESY